MANDVILTFTGRYVRPLDLRVEDVVIEDIAHSLGYQCRFAGHSRVFASVAQHSVNVALHVEAQSNDPMLGLWGLLHDAAEAYLTDVPRPVKHGPGVMPGFIEAEHRAMAVIVEKFGLRPAEEPDIVKYWDKVMVQAELRDFLESPRDVPEVPVPLVSWSPDASEKMFRFKFNEYMGVPSQ